MWPRWRPSPFPRMRLFEELKVFGLIQRSSMMVDAISVVPGVFTVFRRQPALDLGGFTVGMNGEDGDFTMRMGRLGWRVRMDPKIVVYEDVPPTYMEIREQRVRWSRATFHNQSRHGPYRAGIATPQTWFSQSHQFFGRAFAPIRMMLPVYLLGIAVFQGTYRLPVLAFIGLRLVGSVMAMLIEMTLAVAYKKERHLGWVLLWPVWQFFILQFSTESWLSLPGRPASLITGSKPAAVVKAVVH